LAPWQDFAESRQFALQHSDIAVKTSADAALLAQVADHLLFDLSQNSIGI
jgi:hypothetical protein